MLNRYYADELAFLREMGREFARAHPDAAGLLGEGGADPDVERLLEGFAFLTGRLRQKLDDELPELAHALVETFWPYWLCPVPALAIVQCESARVGDREVRAVPRGTAIDSAPVDGTRCRFHTAYDVQLIPVRIDDVAVRGGGPTTLTLKLTFVEALNPQKPLPSTLRLHLTGGADKAGALLACFLRHAERGEAVAGARTVPLPLPKAVGFSADELLLDAGSAGSGAAAPGIAVLRDWLAFPAKFHFVDLPGFDTLPKLVQGGVSVREVELRYTLTRLPKPMPAVSAANVLLSCTPVVNLFVHEGDPIVLDHARRDYRVRPTGERPDHLEVHTVTAVSGQVRGEAKARIYRPLFRAEPAALAAAGGYTLRRRPAVVGPGTECHLRLIDGGDGGAQRPLSATETLSLSLRCTNRTLPAALAAGDINQPTPQTPPGVRFRNLAAPTPTINHAPDGRLLWRVIAHLAGRWRGFAEVSDLRALLDLYHARAQVEQPARQALARLRDACTTLTTRPATVVRGGVPLRGIDLELTVDDGRFDGEGELLLFTLVVDELIAHATSLNAFSRLSVRGAGNGDVLARAPRLGRQQLV